MRSQHPKKLLSFELAITVRSIPICILEVETDNEEKTINGPIISLILFFILFDLARWLEMSFSDDNYDYFVQYGKDLSTVSLHKISAFEPIVL